MKNNELLFTPIEQNLIYSILKPFKVEGRFTPNFIQGFGEGNLEETYMETQHLLKKIDEYIALLNELESKEDELKNIIDSYPSFFGFNQTTILAESIPTYLEMQLSRVSAVMLLRILGERLNIENET